MRILLRRMAKDKWSFSRRLFEFSDKGVGRAVYTATGPDRSYSLIAFGHDLPSDMRSDRVIATAWDATFTLFDGVPTEADIDRLSKNIPHQEAGRVTESEISVSRANKSVRLWDHVVDALSKGFQPDPTMLQSVGYLMRTTAVYGSGKLGAADYDTLCDRSELRAPFQAEMLSVYLTRTFVRDLVNHMARLRGGETAVPLDQGLARHLGIGNSTGLGLAPFIINHPRLFNNWITAREEAIARVRSIETAMDRDIVLFNDLLKRSHRSFAQSTSDHPVQQAKIDQLRQDLEHALQHLKNQGLARSYPWDWLVTWSETTLSEEGQELIASLILEPHGALVDDLADTLCDTTEGIPRINGGMSIGAIRSRIENDFGWALTTDWDAHESFARAWYVSEEKLEPRLGERFEEPIEPYEQPLAIARDIDLANRALRAWDDDRVVAEFLLAHPEHRHIIRRIQIAGTAPYSEIRDNTICAKMFPVDMLRAKLAFFGATQFDPRSDRWLRIAMYQNAPYPDELSKDSAEFWPYARAQA